MKVSKGRSLQRSHSSVCNSGEGVRAGGPHKEPGKAHWRTLGLPYYPWCCGTAQLTADNKQHTLLIGHVPEQQRTGPPEAAVAREEVEGGGVSKGHLVVG